MTALDYAVLTIVGCSVLLSVIRGLTREVMALAGWVVAFLVANVFSAPVSTLLSSAITDPSLRLLAAFVLLFVVTLILMGLLAIAASRLMRTAGLGAEDRVLGSVFGLARGVFIVLVLALLAGLTALPRQPVWNNAMLSAPLEALAVSVKPWLPQQLSQRITYD